MIREDSLVQGVDFKGNEIQGKVEHIVGFGDVAIIRVNEDRTGLVNAYISDLYEK
jgi:predicted RNA-binding protein with RPS1 domain